MAARPALQPDDPGLALALALVVSSAAPLLLLDSDFRIVAVSASFGRTFGIDCEGLAGRSLSDLGGGEWNAPRLHSLIQATASGDAEIDAYEMDLEAPGREPRRLVFNVKRIAFGEPGGFRLLVSVTDVTEARASARKAEDLARQNEMLIQEVRHRVANSLQIIASVLTQNARRSQSAETRTHLNDARQRLLSVADLQQHLAASTQGSVEIHAYLTKLCATLAASMIADPERLVLEVAAEDRMIDAGFSVSLGLIVTELVMNALKHAFPKGAGGRIVVTYGTDDGAWTLSVRDNGCGMPGRREAAGSGLGTSIVEALARQHGARVVVEAMSPGTSVSIVRDAETGSAFRPAAAVLRPDAVAQRVVL